MKGHLLSLVKGLTKYGFDVEAACPSDSSVFNELNGLGIKTHPIHIVGPISPREDLLCINQLKRIISGGEFELLHFHGAKAGMVGRIAAVLADCKNTVLTVHNFIVYREVPWMKKLIFHFGERALSRTTSKIITVSSALKDDLVRNFKIPEAKIVPIYNGIDIEQYLKTQNKYIAKKQYGINPDKPVIGTIARMAPQKGLEYLIKATPEICEERDVEIVIAGDGPEMPFLKDLSKSLGMDKNILFTGYIDNIPDFLSCLDIFVVPSIAEGLSITTIEAMTAGLPVVASNTGGLPELVRHGETGLLVEPRNPKSIADAVLKLLDDPDKREKMGYLGRNHAAVQFSTKTMIDKTCEVYSEILQNRQTESIKQGVADKWG